jgi:magnesium transporter
MIGHSLNAADELLDVWPSLRRSERVDQFEALPRELMDNFFLALDAPAQSSLLMALPEGERRLYMRLLAPDDAADVVQSSPKRSRSYLMDLLDDKSKQEVTALLAYRDDVAGGLMNPRFARLRPDLTIDQALTYLRQQIGQVETIHYGYVLDYQQKLLGVVSLKDLVAADPGKTIRDVMTIRPYTVTENSNEMESAHLFTQHGLKAIPVLDDQGHMKGVITGDDLIDVLREQDTEDMLKLGGMEALDGPYFETTFLAMIKKRAGWLVILFLGEMLTATAMSHFEHEIERAVVLSLFIPLLISSGGNSGSQATSLIIRALALREVRLRDWWRVIRREVVAGIMLGAILGVVGFTRIIVWQMLWQTYGQHYLLIALTIAFSLLGVVTFGTLAGSMLPFLLRKCGMDPASASAPFVATLVDVTGLIIYFTVAKIVLTGTLL